MILRNGHWYSEIDGHHICLHYNTYFDNMHTSPNDSDSTKELRNQLLNLRELMNASEIPNEQADTELERECYLMRRLLRCWQAATAKDYSTDERVLLNRLTARVLDGV